MTFKFKFKFEFTGTGTGPGNRDSGSSSHVMRPGRRGTVTVTGRSESASESRVQRSLITGSLARLRRRARASLLTSASETTTTSNDQLEVLFQVQVRLRNSRQGHGPQAEVQFLKFILIGRLHSSRTWMVWVFSTFGGLVYQVFVPEMYSCIESLVPVNFEVHGYRTH